MAPQPVLPRVIFGTSHLGNLFHAPSHEEKREVVEKIVTEMGKFSFMCPDED